MLFASRERRLQSDQFNTLNAFKWPISVVRTSLHAQKHGTCKRYKSTGTLMHEMG